MAKRRTQKLHALYAFRKSRSTSPADGPGYLYAFLDNGLYWKVGTTNNITRRRREWDRDCPCASRRWLVLVPVRRRRRAAHLLLEIECYDRPESSVLDAAKFIARKWILLQDVLINNHTSLYTFDNNCQLSRTTIAKKYYTQGKTLKISAAALPLLSQAKDKTPGNKKPSSKIFIIAVRESMKLKSALSSRFNGVNGIGQAIGWLLRANDSSRQLVNSTVSMGQFTKISIQSEESIMSPRVFTHKQRDSMFPSARVYFCLNEFQVVCLIARIEQHTKMNWSPRMFTHEFKSVHRVSTCIQRESKPSQRESMFAQHSMEHQSKVPLIRSSRSKMFNWHFRSKSIVQVRDTSQSQQYKFGIRVKVYYWPKNGFIVLQLVTSACYPTVQFESIPGSAELQYFQCQRDDR
ncbi:hypothetical protein C8R42DRAFT_649362 [Lentinula raphanica]|nr:hypothetical protein C8R42DRAFT_649362 [Lentinula raphanica]